MELDRAFALVQRGGLATTEALAPAGVPRSAISRAALQGKLVRVARGLYSAGGEVDDLHRPARLGTVSHTTAAHVHGFPLLAPPGRHVTMTHRLRSVPRGVRLHRRTLPPADRVEIHGLPVTTPRRTAADCATWLPEPDAVVLLDHVLRSGAVGGADLAGSPRLLRRLALADARAESPLESLARLVFHHAGLAPELQAIVTDRGTFVARVDFLFREQRLVVEVDGFEYHAGRSHFLRDRERLNTLVVLGFQVLRFGWEDVVHHPDAVVATIRQALRAPR